MRPNSKNKWAKAKIHRQKSSEQMNCRVIWGEMNMRCEKKCGVIAGAELEAAVGDGVNRLPFTSGHHPFLQPSGAQEQNITSTSSKSYLSTGIGFHTLRKAKKDTCEFSM